MIYKNIKGFEGLYKISDTGIVLALDRKVKMPNGGYKILKESFPSMIPNYKGYLKVMLTDKNGIRKGYFVHRLVGLNFIENKFNKPQINHKDKNRKNNNISNLEWVTNRENSIHKIDKTKTSSIYYGVTKSRNNRWQAQAHIKGRNIYIGMFKTQQEASKAVQKACHI